MCQILYHHNKILLVYLLVFCSGGALVASAGLKIKHEDILENTPYLFTCSSDNESVGCQFQVRNDDTDEHSKIVEISKFNTHGEGTSYVKYTAVYNSIGTEVNCSLKVHQLKKGRYLFGCRIYIVNEGWEYEFQSLRVANKGFWGKRWSPLTVKTPVDGGASLTHALDERNVNVICHTAVPKELKNCKFLLPYNKPGDGFIRKIINYVLRGTTTPQYAGRGLESGDCGYNIEKVTAEHNGLFWCDMTTEIQSGHGAFPFIITRAASEHSVTLMTDRSAYKVGDTLTAHCTVSNCRPAPVFSWRLGGKAWSNISEESSWTWPWDVQNITQTVTFTVIKPYFTHALECTVGHPSWWKNFTKKFNIPEDKGVTSSDSHLNTEATITNTTDSSESTSKSSEVHIWIYVAISTLIIIIVIGIILGCRKIRILYNIEAEPQKLSELMDNDLYADENENASVNERPPLPLPEGIAGSRTSEHLYDYADPDVFRSARVQAAIKPDVTCSLPKRTNFENKQEEPEYQQPFNIYEEIPVFPGSSVVI